MSLGPLTITAKSQQWMSTQLYQSKLFNNQWFKASQMITVSSVISRYPKVSNYNSRKTPDINPIIRVTLVPLSILNRLILLFNHQRSPVISQFIDCANLLSFLY